MNPQVGKSPNAEAPAVPVCDRPGCETPLSGRQTRWCSRRCWALGNGKIGWFWRLLHDKQEGLCGICVLPLDVPRGFLNYEPDKAGLVYVSPFDDKNVHRRLVEVDHVNPRSLGGLDDLPNLRAAHGACNQARKAQPLDVFRWKIGLVAHEVERRLTVAGVGETGKEAVRWPLVTKRPDGAPGRQGELWR